mgnify:CR=1 FL=1
MNLHRRARSCPSIEPDGSDGCRRGWRSSKHPGRRDSASGRATRDSGASARKGNPASRTAPVGRIACREATGLASSSRPSLEGGGAKWRPGSPRSRGCLAPRWAPGCGRLGSAGPRTSNRRKHRTATNPRARASCSIWIKAMRQTYGIQPGRTQPYRPRTNGKAGRLIQTLL